MFITKAMIRSLANAESYQKGEDYYHTNAVIHLLKRGNTLLAEVEGSGYAPYQVTVELAENRIVSTHCTCPYDWGGVCKHIVAVLLMVVRQPERIEEHPSVQELLAPVSAADLRAVLSDLLTVEPRLIAHVEAMLAALQSRAQQTTVIAKPASPRPTLIDPASFRRQVQQIVRHADYRGSYGAGWDMAHQISQLLQHVRPFLDGGDGQNALFVLKAIIEPVLGCWYDYDEDGEFGDLFAEAAPLFTQALLCQDVTGADRAEWGKRLTKWQHELSDYGLDDTFDAAVAATGQGWEYPPLQTVLQGRITESGAWESEAPEYADDLAVARLKVLAQQGRTQEYLYLAEAEGQIALYLTMLVNVGRAEDAITYARQQATTTDEVLALAQALHANHYPIEAIAIAEHGLTLQGDPLALARWLRDAAAQSAQIDVALRAAKTAFSRSLLMDDYRAAEAVAGSAWPSVKPEFLEQLNGARYAFDKIDIYLYEGLLDKAMKVVDSQTTPHYEIVAKVVDAVWQNHPLWAIRHCKQQAEALMDSGKSKYYPYAAQWLERAARAYAATPKAKEWHAYLDNLIVKHARKSSLRPHLERLRKM